MYSRAYKFAIISVPSMLSVYIMQSSAVGLRWKALYNSRSIIIIIYSIFHILHSFDFDNTMYNHSSVI